MKKVTIALVLTMVAFAATTALAQSQIAVRADVPMGFSVDGQHYSAGSYELRTISTRIIRLQNRKTGQAGLVTLKSPDQAKLSAPPVLRFAVNGKRAWLTSFSDGQGTTWQVRVAARDLEASRSEQTKTILVA